MLEFAYTGEVNVAQELLPNLLSTARSFRIKGLDKVESPLQEDPAPAAPPAPAPRQWDAPRSPAAASRPSTEEDIKPFDQQPQLQQQQQQQHFEERSAAHHVGLPKQPLHPSLLATSMLKNLNGRREHSRPATREASPEAGSRPGSSGGSRTPPPKRWKRSFDEDVKDEHLVSSEKTS